MDHKNSSLEIHIKYALLVLLSDSRLQVIISLFRVIVVAVSVSFSSFFSLVFGFDLVFGLAQPYRPHSPTGTNLLKYIENVSSNHIKTHFKHTIS